MTVISMLVKRICLTLSDTNFIFPMEYPFQVKAIV